MVGYQNADAKNVWIVENNPPSGALPCRECVCRDCFAALSVTGTVPSAVEFAILAFPFLALLFAVMQTALIFFAQQTLETAAADSARLVLTGQMREGQQG